MQNSLRNKLRNLFRELNGGEVFATEDHLVRVAAAQIVGDASEEELIEAAFTAIDDDNPRPQPAPAAIIVNDPDDFDQILDAIAASYGGVPTRTAGTRADLSSGRDGDEYDEDGKAYRGDDREADAGDETIQILDGVHDDIPYHRDATEVPGLPRTRHESLQRS